MLKKIQIIKLVKIPNKIFKWVEWLNNKEVTKYSEKRHKKHTISSQKKFIQRKLKSKKNIIFKIIYKKKFVGVLEISFINKIKKNCELSYMIGDTESWGKGIATKAISLALIYSKKKTFFEKGIFWS